MASLAWKERKRTQLVRSMCAPLLAHALALLHRDTPKCWAEAHGAWALTPAFE